MTHDERLLWLELQKVLRDCATAVQSTVCAVRADSESQRRQALVYAEANLEVLNSHVLSLNHEITRQFEPEKYQ